MPHKSHIVELCKRQSYKMRIDPRKKSEKFETEKRSKCTNVHTIVNILRHNHRHLWFIVPLPISVQLFRGFKIFCSNKNYTETVTCTVSENRSTIILTFIFLGASVIVAIFSGNKMPM